MDALLQAINAATGIAGVLKEYHVAAVTADTDALGEVSVLVEHEGRLVSGQSVSTDTLEASARAYLRALSNARGGRRRRAAAADARRKPGLGLSRARLHLGDGERLIRFGAARSPKRRACWRPRVRRLCAADHGAGGGARAALAEGADVVLDVPPGPVPEAAAAVRERVGAGRWWRSAAAA